jgi:hypothetical protein
MRAMSLPTANDACWKRLLTAEPAPNLTSLATKLTVARLRRDVKQQPSMLKAAIDELYGFFAKNDFAQRDLALI